MKKLYSAFSPVVRKCCMMTGIFFLFFSASVHAQSKPKPGTSKDSMINRQNDKQAAFASTHGNALKEIEKLEIPEETTGNKKPTKTKADLKKSTLRLEWWKKLDEEWKSVFKKALQLTGEPQQRQLDSLFLLEELNCASAKITSLEPLKGFQNLAKLNLMRTEVTDLSPLQALPNLEKVNCTYSKASPQAMEALRTQRPDMEVMPVLTMDWWNTLNDEWKKIFKMATKVTTEPTLMDLNKMYSLTKIICSSKTVNPFMIDNIEPVAKLKNLRVLYLSNTQITSLEPVRNLTNLKVLHFADTKIEDLSPVKNLTELIDLDCSMTQVNSLEPIAHLTGLKKLSCYETKITTLDPVAKLTNLVELNCFDNQITSLEPLRNLVNLQVLVCGDTQVSDLSPLNNLTRMRTLKFFNTAVTDLKPLSNMPYLASLSLASTKITDLAPISNHKNLAELNCAYTGIASLEPIRNHQRLAVLDFSGTKVTDLSPVGNLVNLKSLWFSSNQITTLAPIQKLKKLVTLECAETGISLAEINKFKADHPECTVH